MAPMFYRNANAALLVFDITSTETFENMKGWVQELKGNVLEPMVLVVVGNKIDLADQRQVSLKITLIGHTFNRPRPREISTMILQYLL